MTIRRMFLEVKKKMEPRGEIRREVGTKSGGWIESEGEARIGKRIKVWRKKGIESDITEVVAGIAVVNELKEENVLEVTMMITVEAVTVTLTGYYCSRTMYSYA